MRTLPHLLTVLVGLTFCMSVAPANAHMDNLTFAPVLKKVTPAVVNVSVTAHRNQVQNPLLNDPFFRRFFEMPDAPQQSVPRQSVGSGVIIDADKGYVVTNHHVVDGADEISITLVDRRQFRAELIGSDPGTDIALLKIDAPRLSEVPLGDSDALEVGDFVVAIGNPFGLGQTVTSGIVSALGRSGLNIDGYEDFIQTDASINPGNSGGALVDLRGRLIGINTAIIAPAGGNVGIGFAIPTSMMSAVVEQLVEHGEVHRGRLGITIQDVTPDLADALDLDTPEGALVSQVEAGSPAQDAGLQAGDVIVQLDEHPIADASELRNRVGLMAVGEEVALELIRDGRRITKKAQIGEQADHEMAGEATSPKLDGADFRNLTPDNPAYGRVAGVEVSAVRPGTRAWSAGLREGDVILSVNRQPVDSVASFRDRIEKAEGVLALHVLRVDTRLFLVVR